MASNREYFNSQSEAIREKAMCADGTTESPIIPENTYNLAADLLKTAAACAVVLGVGMGFMWTIKKVTKK